jgi:GT2 family glycosyltransferase
MFKTAIVILNWNGIGFLKQFLPTVIRHSTENNTVIYIADNGSTDGSAEWIEANHKDVKLIRLEKNHGFAGGYNLALAKIKAEYYILLNSDIEVTAGWLYPLIDFMDKNPDVASCQPKILSYNKKDHFEYAGASGGFIDKYGYPFCRGRILHKTEKDTGQYDDPVDTFWSSGACMIVRASAWKKCGGLDASFFAHMEEIDLCWRFHKAGFRVCCNPTSVVYHVGGGTLPYNSNLKTYLNFRNSLFMLYKNLPDKDLEIIIFRRKLLDGLAGIFFLFKGKFKSIKSIFKAHMDYYKCDSILVDKREAVKKLEKKNINIPVLNKSIVFEFYVKWNKTFNSIKGINNLK